MNEMRCGICNKETKRKDLVKVQDDFGKYALCHEECAESSGIPLKWKINTKK